MARLELTEGRINIAEARKVALAESRLKDLMDANAVEFASKEDALKTLKDVATADKGKFSSILKALADFLK